MTDIAQQPDTAAVDAAPTTSLWHRLYHGETTFDFVGRRRIGFIISGVVILLTLVSLVVRDLNLGIDFEGGVSWEVPSAQLDKDAVEGILSKHGININDTKIQFLSGSRDTVRVQAPEQTPEALQAINADFIAAAGVQPSDLSVSNVSSTWGNEITKKALFALVVFVALLSVYISWRFEWKMAVAAILAMLHDVVVSIGAYSVFQFVVTPATVIAFLTILGFSLYDTIVVFDKVHENAKRFGTSKVGYGDIVNLSMNQVLMRSLNTSIAAVLPVLSVLVVGAWIMDAEALVDFALALLIGMITGAYSSIFIATPVLAMLKQREKRYAGLASRHASGEELTRLRTAGAAALAGTRAGRATGVGTAAPTGAAGVEAARAAVNDPGLVLQHPPRPRKKRRR